MTKVRDENRTGNWNEFMDEDQDRKCEKLTYSEIPDPDNGFRWRLSYFTE